MVGLQEAPSRRASESFIFDIPVDLAHPGELLNRITGWVARGDRGRRVMYVNAHVLNQSLEQPALREAPRPPRATTRSSRRPGDLRAHARSGAGERPLVLPMPDVPNSMAIG